MDYKCAKERGEIAKDLLIEVLEFDDVIPYENLKKSEIIDILNKLQEKALYF